MVEGRAGMMKAKKAGWVLAGCWSTVCLAHPAADRADAYSGTGGAGVYAPATQQPTARFSAPEWSTLTAMLSPYRLHPSVLDTDWLSDRMLADPSNTSGTGMGLGYSWRNMKLEGALISVREGRELPPGTPKLFTAATSRLSYQPIPNVTFQLARGRLSRQNTATDTDDDVHRTSLAAIYSRPVRGADWQTTLAMGKTTGRTDGAGSNKVFLLESSMRFKRAHTVFARVERASAAELFTDRDALYGQDFNANRLTAGYVYAISLGQRSQLSFGGAVSKRSMPQEAAAVLGNDPPSSKVFMRVSLQMP